MCDTHAVCALTCTSTQGETDWSTLTNYTHLFSHMSTDVYVDIYVGQMTNTQIDHTDSTPPLPRYNMLMEQLTYHSCIFMQMGRYWIRWAECKVAHFSEIPAVSENSFLLAWGRKHIDSEIMQQTDENTSVSWIMMYVWHKFGKCLGLSYKQLQHSWSNQYCLCKC